MAKNLNISQIQILTIVPLLRTRADFHGHWCLFSKNNLMPALSDHQFHLRFLFFVTVVVNLSCGKPYLYHKHRFHKKPQFKPNCFPSCVEQELLKLRKKITTTVQVLTHLKEKLQFVQAENSEQRSSLRTVEAHAAQVSLSSAPVTSASKERRSRQVTLAWQQFFWMTTNRRHHLKSEFALFQTSSMLFDFIFCQIMGLNPKGPYLCLEKEHFCVLFTYSIKRAREIRKFHVIVAVVQRRQRNVQKRDARAELLCY